MPDWRDLPHNYDFGIGYDPAYRMIFHDYGAPQIVHATPDELQ